MLENRSNSIGWKVYIISLTYNLPIKGKTWRLFEAFLPGWDTVCAKSHYGAL
jgi:hypothetical protein